VHITKTPRLFSESMKGLKISSVLWLILLLILSNCSPPVLKNPTPVNQPSTQGSSLIELEYRIQVGDQLDVKFYYNPELNEQVIVRPDGRISLQLIHEVSVVGLTPDELTQLLTRQYAAQLNKPELTVIVRAFGGHKVYVDGEVAKPGMLPLVGTMNVLQAISQAGGMKESARVNEVIVIRHGAANQPYAFSVNLEKAIDGTDLRQNIPLKAFDIVFVPRSPIANVNVWVDQYLRKNIPIQTGFFYNFP
jgi:polysaccharide export outer membrane protein